MNVLHFLAVSALAVVLAGLLVAFTLVVAG
jgi:hypothetical protein